MLLKMSVIRKKLLVVFFIVDAIFLAIYFQKIGIGKLSEFSNFFNLPNQNRGSFIQVINKAKINSGTTYGGVSWGDYDSDGYLDLLLPDQRGQYKLYKNNHNGTFTDVTEKVNLGLVSRDAKAAIFGDYDNDGCPDIYMSAHGPITTINTPGSSDVLYHNNCNGTFSDVSAKAGIADTYHGWGVAWADYDNDGFLDLYVANWGVMKSRSDWSFEPNILYHNNGNGTFSNVTTKAGVVGLANCKKYKTWQLHPGSDKRNTNKDEVAQGLKVSWQPVWFDYNNDGWPDLYVSHESGIGVLYHNNGNGTFTDVTEEASLCQLSSSHGLAVGDYDGDGYLDLYAGGTFRNLLWHNNGNGTFSEISEEAGAANFGFLGWGVGFFDYDNDGDLDIYSANGVPSGNSPTDSGLKVRSQIHKKFDQLYRNNGDGSFTEASAEEGLFGDDSKSGGALGDYNNDGSVDIFIISDSHPDQINSSSSRLYRNTPNGNHWLTIQLIGTKSNRDAVGARITVKTGNKSQMREVISGSSLLSQNSLWQTFGLGKNKVVDEIEIKWPSGIKQILKEIKPNQKIIVKESY